MIATETSQKPAKIEAHSPTLLITNQPTNLNIYKKVKN